MQALTQQEREKKVLSYIEEHQEELYRVLSELVQIDTQNFITKGNENAGQHCLAERCHEIGLKTELYAPDSVEGLVQCDEYNPGRGTDERENLVAVFEGETKENGVMLAAHMDTMPVGELSLWTDSPFSGKVQDGKIYGRGAGDDKFGLALSWYVIKALKDCGITPQKNILLGSYVDEEYGGGNGALGLCLKYPCDCYVNLDSSGYETMALGGGCFEFKVKSTKNDKGIASVFDVFGALNAAREALEQLQKDEPNTTIRLTCFSGGLDGKKEGLLSFAIYTDKTKEEMQDILKHIFSDIAPKLNEANFMSEGFVLTTKFFRFGKTKEDSREAEILKDAIFEITGEKVDGKGSCLSDLSVFLQYGNRNSFSYGMLRGSKDGGGAHQPNEHIECKRLLDTAKSVALMLVRM